MIAIGTGRGSKQESGRPLLERLVGWVAALRTRHESVLLGQLIQQTVHDAHRQLAISGLRAGLTDGALLVFESLSLWQVVKSVADPFAVDMAGPVSAQIAADDMEVMIQLFSQQVGRDSDLVARETEIRSIPQPRTPRRTPIFACHAEQAGAMC